MKGLSIYTYERRFCEATMKKENQEKDDLKKKD